MSHVLQDLRVLRRWAWTRHRAAPIGAGLGLLLSAALILGLVVHDLVTISGSSAEDEAGDALILGVVILYGPLVVLGAGTLGWGFGALLSWVIRRCGLCLVRRTGPA